MDKLIELRALLGELPETSVPLLLLPVRLETRFVTQASENELLVRVYPDDIHIDTHEPELTEDEVTWGKAYWENVWRAGKSDEAEPAARRRQAWAQLAQRFGPERAAWVAWALRPTNLNDQPAAPVPDGTSLPKPPQFPSPSLRADSWTRPPLVRMLPSRWVFCGYRGGRRVVLHWGEPITNRLTAGPDPSAPPVQAGDDVLAVDESMKWLIDFDAAVKVGMAARIPLTIEDVKLGFETLLVFGVNPGSDGLDPASAMESLLLAQLYTAGMDLVATGTPTNNSGEANSGFSPRDPNRVEIPPALTPTKPADNTDGAIAARFLGCNEEIFGRLASHGLKDRQDARAMITALWPATGGYFLEQMMADTFAATAIEGARRHTIEFVRGRGPLPMLRIGAQPYGLLPTSSLDGWKPRDGEDAFVSILRGLRQRWRNATAHVPKIDRVSNDPDSAQRIIDVLLGEAVSSGHNARLLFDALMFGVPDLHRNAPAFAPLEQRRARVRQLLTQLGVNWTPRLLDTVPADKTFAIVPKRETPEPEGNGEPAEKIATPAEYLRWLRESSFEAIRDETGLPGKAPESLLYLALRHSVLVALATVAFRIQVGAGAVQIADGREPAVVDLMSPGMRTLGRHPEHPLPGLADKPLHSLTAKDHPAAALLDDMRASLAHLETLSEESLDLLLVETLDLFAYRLDAWITSLATRRLDRMRTATPRGFGVGGYGWLENVRRGAPLENATPPPGEPGPLRVDPASAGFIQAPSLDQASTAAILRSGAIAMKEGTNDLFDIDLSSRRVRLAESLLDGIRQGQPAGAVLGYRFERGLHDRQLDRYIAVFRKLAPFGDLQKAQVAVEQAEAEVARLRQLGHPDFPAAQNRFTAAKTRHEKLLAEQKALPGRVIAAEGDLQRINQQLQPINADIQRVSAQIIKFQNMRPPRVTDQLDEQLADLMGKRQSLDNQRKEATARLNEAKKRTEAIPAEIQNATRELQEAQRLVNDLQGRPHPDLANAEKAADEARNRHQALLNEYRRTFLFPSDAPQQALEAVAATHVVDGLALLKRYKAGDLVFGRDGLPAPNSKDHQQLLKELNALEDAVDAVRDVMVVEGVYQLVQGRPARTHADLDALAGGEIPPPELESLRTPRRGIAVTHRVIALLSTASEATASGWPETPRAKAEPVINRWAARLLGKPDKIRFQVVYTDAGGKTLHTRNLRLSEVGLLAPIDVLHIAQGARKGRYAEIEQLLLHLAERTRPANVPPTAVAHLSGERPANAAADERGLLEALDLAHLAGRLVANARALKDSDLEQPDVAAEPTVDHTELAARANQAAAGLQQASDALKAGITSGDSGKIVAALAQVALFGIAEAIPDAAPLSRIDKDELKAKATEAQRILARRLEELKALTAPQPGSPEAIRDHHLARFEVIFGGTLRVLPRLKPANLTTLNKAFESSVDLQGNDPFAATTWIRRMARVRRPLDRLNNFMLHAELLEAGVPDLRVAQLPLRPNDRWVALTAPPADSAGTLSLVACLPEAIPADAPLAGLWIDEWVEVVPDSQVTTGIAFHFNEPASQPPQAILIAVPPDDSPRWDITHVESIALETLDLARIRAVDPETLDAHTDVGQVLPALCFGLNLQNHTVSTDFRRVAEAQ